MDFVFKVAQSVVLFSFIMFTPLYAYKSNEKLPPQEAVEFQRSVQELEAQRLKAHEELKAKGGTTEQHKMIDDEALAKARSLETKRTSSLKKLAKQSGVKEISQGKYGTKPTEGRGGFGDVDTPNFSGKDFEKIRSTAIDEGYTVTGDGDTMHIKELDTTVHREPSKYKSQTGSSAADAEAAGGYGKETSRKLQTGDKTTEVLDNLGKSGNTLNKPTNQMKSSDWQEMGKMTGRNMDAADIVDPKFREQVEMLKKGYRPESVGIDDMDAFQQKCRDLNNQAAKKVRTDAKVKEVKLKEKLTQAKSDLEKAQSTGNQKKIREATNKVKRTQSEIAEHSKTQKAAEDSFKKNQPKEAKKVLEETKPPPKEDIDDMIKQERAAKKAKAPSDADDLVQKPKGPSDADDMMGKKPKAPSDADDMMGKSGKQPKGTAPTSGKKTYVKVAKDAVTGAVTAIVIFSTAEDIKQKLKEGDVKGAGKIIADNLTGGAISITEQNVEKYSDYQEMKNKIAYANKMEYEAYVIKAGLKLRENGVSADEAEKIMEAMRRGDKSAFENKRSELQKAGKNISITPPKHIDNIGGDEDIITRTADVFVAIGDGILAMPGKAKKFLSEAASDVYEIVGGLTEKGVLTELYNQKVESANNLLDIAKNEYRAYAVNKEIEEQKERKDKLEMQKDLRESLIKQGYSFEEANEIAKKAAQNNDWSAYRNARNNVKANKAAKDFADEMGIYPEDFLKFANCMCRGCGGSLGGNFNPAFKSDIGHGPCQCNGPLTIWKTPLPTGKKEAFECINSIVAEHYQNDQKIFEEWHQKLRDENYKSVKEEVDQIEQHIEKEEFLLAADMYLSIANLIQDYMVTRYYNGQAQGENLTYFLPAKISNGLSKQAQEHVRDIEMEKPLATAVKKANKAVELLPKNEVLKQHADQYAMWEEGWKEFVSKDVQKIKGEIKSGKINTATASLQAVQAKINQQQLPPRHNDPKLTELFDLLKEQRNAYSLAMQKNTEELASLNKEPDPRNIVKTIEKVLKEWEHPQMTSETLGRQHAEAAQNVRIAEANDKAGDKYKEENKYANAVDRYQVSLKLQKDSAVQRKLDALLKNHERAMANKKEGDADLKEQKLSSAISKYKVSVYQWPDPNLSNLIAQLERQLKAQKEQAALKAKIAKLEREKKAASRAPVDDGFDLGDRFGSRESSRTQEVADKRSRDAYTAASSTRNTDYEKMIGQLSNQLSGLEKNHLPSYTPVPDAPISTGTSSATASSSASESSGSKIFTSGNISAVQNNPKKPTTFSLKSTCKLTSISNYHWNDAKGSKPGTIAVRDQAGKVTGPWPTIGKPGQGGVPNAYWIATPNVLLPAGTYTVIDSEPSTWAQNAQSDYRGMTDVVADCGQSSGSTSSSSLSSGLSTSTASQTSSGIFAGTMNGTWKGTGAHQDAYSGNFTMQISSNGSVVIKYGGDDEGTFTGNILSSGTLDIKQAAGTSGSFSWKGTIKKDSKGNLSGSGTWSDDDVKGTWQSQGTASATTTKAPSATSSFRLPAIYKGNAVVTTTQSGKATFPVTIVMEDHIVGPENLKQFKYNMTVEYGFRFYCGQRRIHVDSANNSAFAYFAADKKTFNIPNLGIWSGKFTDTSLQASYSKKYCSTLDDTITININLKRAN